MDFLHRIIVFLNFHKGSMISHPGGGQFYMNFALGDQE